jgi:DNA-directed RNA polymerase subunit RPC12/RpoP
MAALIKITTIRCPNCGSTQKVELRLGDYRCESCGTEYFLDNGSINIRPQGPARQTIPTTPDKKSHASLFFWSALLLFTIGIVWHHAYYASPGTAATDVDSVDDNGWYARDGLLYLSADGRPIEIAFGVNRIYGNALRSTDYVAFYDVSQKTQINRMPMPDARTEANRTTIFNTQQFSNGDIYIVANDKVVCVVPKGTYSAMDVTKSLFANQPELVSGIAKVDMLSKRDGEGFDLFTNDGRNYVYLPATGKLYSKKAFGDLRPYIDYGRHPLPGAVQQTGFDFSKAYNLDNAGTGAKLLTFRYMALRGDRTDFSFEWLSYSPDTAAQLKRYGISSLRDLTPGRIYFSQRIAYYDSSYVVISYRLTPADDARRVIQCLNAQTGAVIFTTPFDDKYAPGNCIRYAGGFVIEDDPEIFLLNMTGKLTTYSHIMGQHK